MNVSEWDPGCLSALALHDAWEQVVKGSRVWAGSHICTGVLCWGGWQF